MTKKKKRDIVDRLRDWGHPDWYYVTTDLLSDNEDVRREAADEIERLRRVVSFKQRVERVTAPVGGEKQGCIGGSCGLCWG